MSEDSMTDDLAGYSQADWRRLALDIVFKERLHTDNSFPWGGSIERCDRVLERIPVCRAKYADLEPPRLRRAVMDWLNHYEWAARKNREDCRTQGRRRYYDRVGERMKAERKRTREMKEKLGMT